MVALNTTFYKICFYSVGAAGIVPFNTLQIDPTGCVGGIVIPLLDPRIILSAP